MRLAEIPGLSGPSTVAVIHSSESVATLEAFFAARDIEARAVEAPDWVQIGTAYDGTDFVEPEPAPEPFPEPSAIPVLTLAEARAQLDAIRERLLSDYVAQWGEASRREIWNLLAADVRDITGVPIASIIPDAYPNLVGFLIGSNDLPMSYPADTGGSEAEQAQRLALQQQLLAGVAANLRGHQSQHVALVRRTEQQRARAIAAFEALDEVAKEAWDAATAWADAEVG
jgi:hypothetical protein